MQDDNRPTMKLLKSLLPAALFFGVISAQAQLINTFPSWDGSNAISPFGEPSFSTVGQVFTVQAGFTQLDGFAFAGAHAAGGDVTFAVFLAEWDSANLRATGPILFAAGPATLTSSDGAFTVLPVFTGGLSLSAGTQYVAFLNTSLFFNVVADAGKLGFIGSDVYAGGGAVAFDSGADTSVLFTNTWATSADDLAFAASFSPGASAVPEPSTYGLWAVASVAALVIARKRRIAAAA
jgi:hypothetical protein